MAMQIVLTPRQMQNAFIAAESDTSEHFNGQTCSLKTKDGDSTCPICFFHIAYRRHLGIDETEYQAGLAEIV